MVWAGPPTPGLAAPVKPTLEQIQLAEALIRPLIPETPAFRWPLLQEPCGGGLWIKHENHTPVGAFKIRGGLVYLDELMRREQELPGVIAASTGNHGQSIAFAARRRGVRAVIVVPQGNNPEKNRAIRSLGADLIEHGREFQEALEFSRHLAQREGLHPVPSFHPWLVRGVATYGLELFRQVPDLDAVFVPIGLGSGFCGLAAAREALGLRVRLVGVVSAQAPAYALSFRAKRLLTQPSATRVAEGVACSTPHPGALESILGEASDVIEVSDGETLEAMRELLQGTHNLVEGAGALAYAALRKQRAAWEGAKVACVLSGGNVSLELLHAALTS